MHKNKWSKKIWPDSSLILCKLWIAKGLVWILLHCFTLFENYSKCRIWILAFSTNFCPIKVDLSGNTVWPQASVFQNLAKMDHFWHFQWTFVHSKCKRSSLLSQCWMRLFLWFSNTVLKYVRQIGYHGLRRWRFIWRFFWWYCTVQIDYRSVLANALKMMCIYTFWEAFKSLFW